MPFSRRERTILHGLAVLAFAVVGYMLFLPIARVSRPTWPPVADPNLLLTECAVLLSDPGEVQEPNWPATIQSLKPRHVTVYDDHVEITISSGGINPAWGYVVYPDEGSSTTAPSGCLIRTRVSDGLFTYETDE